MDARKAQVYQEELNAFLNQAQEKKDLIKEGKYTREEFMEWLKSFKERKN
jgi:hypothetical protein